jgi:ribonuclease Z
MDMSLFFAGTAGSIPTTRRGLPAILLRRGADRILFDCGEGTQRQLVSTVGLTDLTEIFLTHYHADHWLGLPGLLKTFDLRGREKPLTVHGPPGLKALIALTTQAAGSVGYELHLHELEPHEVVLRDGYEIEAIPVSHRGTAYGYMLLEDDRPGTFDPVKARQLGLKEGPEFGRVQRGETVNGVSPERVLGPRRHGRKIVLSGDTIPCNPLKEAAYDADVLVHEATFAQDEAERAWETKHSTAAGAAGLARDAEVVMLALNHISTRYPVAKLRDEARDIFAAAVIPRDFDTIEIPFPERGEPSLTRWDPTSARQEQPAPSGT